MKKTFAFATIAVLLLIPAVAVAQFWYGSAGGAGGDMLKAIYDPAGGAAQVAFESELIGDGIAVGTILYWDGFNWVPTTNTQFFFDSATDEIGIGLTATERRLHILTVGEFGQALFEDDGALGYAGALMRNDLNSRMNFFLGASANILYPNTGALLVTDSIDFVIGEIGGATRMRVGSDESVTIGGGLADIDYRLIFDGESSDGLMTWDEDLINFSFGNDAEFEKEVTAQSVSSEKIAAIEADPNVILGFLNFNTSTTLDSSGYRFDGVDFGTPALLSSELDLDGVSAVDMSGRLNKYADSNAWSVSARVTTAVASGTRCIVSFSDRNVLATHYLVFINSSGYPVFQVVDNAVFKFRYVYEVDIRDGSQHHIMASSGSNGPKFYVDNVLVTNLASGSASDTTSLSGITLTDVNIGRDRNSGGYQYYWDGQIDDVVFMNRETNAQDVARANSLDIYGFDVIALLGQSNMIGTATIRPGIDDDYTTVSGIVYQYGYTSESITAATNPLDNVNETPGTMGLWLEFANKHVSELNYGRGLLLVPAASGGTGFINGEWTPGGTTYENAVVRINAAMALSGLNSFKGILWHQGENDAQGDNTEYQYDITEMHRHLKRDIAGAYNSHMPFICGSMLKTVPGTSSLINSQLEKFANSISGGGFYYASDLASIDSLHYSAASLATIGAAYADLFKSVLKNSGSGVFEIVSAGAVNISSVISPPVLTDNQNNFNPEGIRKCQVVELFTGGPNYFISGIKAIENGRKIVFQNVGTGIGTGNIVFRHDDALSIAENRILLPGGADVTLQRYESITFRYSDNFNRWMTISEAL